MAKETKPKRVIHINSVTQTISETTVECLKDCQNLVGGYIERGLILANGDELYVDEEGLLKNCEFWFSIIGHPRPFAGNAYIIGSVTASGNNRPAISELAEIKKRVTFQQRIA